jgi:hypothetical protein
MKLALSLCLTIALLLTGAPQPSWTENTAKIVAYTGDTNRSTFQETGDNYIDDRIFVSFPLASEESLSDSFLIAAPFNWQSLEEKNLIKKYFKIYKLTSAFLI